MGNLALGSKFKFPIDYNNKLYNILRFDNVPLKELNLNFGGISFHVGSLCESAEDYIGPIADAKKVFEFAEEIIGPQENKILDIGAGFLGEFGNISKFYEKSKIINEALEKYFPKSDKTVGNIIAEPGRFMASSIASVGTQIIGINDSDPKHKLYYINDGIYSSFKG